MVAGRIAEIVTGKEYTALMEETLLRPIGAMTATFHPSEELEAKMPVYYDRNPSGLVPVDVAARKAGAGSLINPASSLIATVDDVGRFLLLHRDKGLVTASGWSPPKRSRRSTSRGARPAGQAMEWDSTS